jgi:hypothetical protein
MEGWVLRPVTGSTGVGVGVRAGVGVGEGRLRSAQVSSGEFPGHVV